MSKTTPEEAYNSAHRHGFALNGSEYCKLAALIDEVRGSGWISEAGVKKLMKTEYDRGYAQAKHDQGVDAEPFMHVYEFASPFGGTVWRDSPDMWNGNKPKRSLPLYTRPTPSQPAAPVELPVVAWLEHHKGGDNLSWEQVDHPYAKADALVKLSDAQAAIAAGRKAS